MLTGEAVRGLPRLRQRVEPSLPSIVRGLVAIAAHPGALSENVSELIGSMNKRRRAATEWLRAILAGSVDAATLRNVAEIWLPMLVGGGAELAARRAQVAVEYVRGAMTGLVLDRPEANLVPEARSVFALESILAIHLGAALRRKAPARDAGTPTKVAR